LGLGLPVALHVILTSWPSMPSTSPGPSVIFGGTATQTRYVHHGEQRRP